MSALQGSDVLTSQQLISMAQGAPGDLECLHTLSHCMMPLELAAQCCQTILQGDLSIVTHML